MSILDDNHGEVNVEDLNDGFVPVTFRHKTIQRFSMSTKIDGEAFDFQFEKHLMTVRSQRAAEVFAELYDKLEIRDKMQIVKLKVAENEEPITRESIGIRGPVSVADIKAPLANQQAGQNGEQPVKAGDEDPPAKQLGLGGLRPQT